MGYRWKAHFFYFQMSCETKQHNLWRLRNIQEKRPPIGRFDLNPSNMAAPDDVTALATKLSQHRNDIDKLPIYISSKKSFDDISLVLDLS